jgi:hypothetical protein
MRTLTHPGRTRIAGIAAGLVSVTTLAALAACSSAGTTAAGASTANTGTSGAQGPRNADYTSAYAIIQCYRQHGDPGAPDPNYDPSDGRWHLDAGFVPQATQRACQHLFPSADPSPAVPQAQFQALVRLAVCIRQHGVPNWPDPNPAGQFPLPPSLLQKKTPTEARALTACQSYVPSGGMNVIAGS